MKPLLTILAKEICLYFHPGGEMCGETATHHADFGAVSGRLPLCSNHVEIYRQKGRCDIDQIVNPTN